MVPISYTCSYDGGPEEDCKQKLLMMAHKLISLCLQVELGQNSPSLSAALSLECRCV